MRPLGGVGILLLTLAAATLAHAGGAQDGEAGLAALKRGSNDEAIRLFTRAIASGDLAPDDQEFAYLNRGKAYLAKGDRVAATADLRLAARLKPDDADAQASLRAALGGGLAGTARPAIRADPHWGLLAAMTGRYYWYQVANTTPGSAFLHADWMTPGQTLSVLVRTKNKTLSAGEYALDSATGKLLAATVSAGGHVRYATVDATAGGAVEYGFADGRPVRLIYRAASGQPAGIDEQSYANGTWTTFWSASLSDVSEQDLAAAGLLKKWAGGR